jgi:predicted regulator of Ras-like GTPase activity (Roadblock/LC7/MglB family)
MGPGRADQEWPTSHALWLSAHGHLPAKLVDAMNASKAAMDKQRPQTNAAIAGFRVAIAKASGLEPAVDKPVAATLLADLPQLTHGSSIAEYSEFQGVLEEGEATSAIAEEASLIGGAGLLAVIVSSVLLLGFGNRISRELTALRGAARRLADERLPSVVNRLRVGGDVDVAVEAPPLNLGTRTREVTETADAFSVVQRMAVADVTHMLAELIENAVQYSPPGTNVQVRGGRVANGYAIEIEDRGLGIPPDTMNTLNERLAAGRPDRLTPGRPACRAGRRRRTWHRSCGAAVPPRQDRGRWRAAIPSRPVRSCQLSSRDCAAVAPRVHLMRPIAVPTAKIPGPDRLESMMTGGTSLGELDWLLDNLVSSVLGVRIAVILSPDGLSLGRSPGLSEAEAGYPAALAADGQSDARGVGVWTGYGDVSQTIIETEAALMFITPAGQHMIANPRFPVQDPVSR